MDKQTKLFVSYSVSKAKLNRGITASAKARSKKVKLNEILKRIKAKRT